MASRIGESCRIFRFWRLFGRFRVRVPDDRVSAENRGSGRVPGVLVAERLATIDVGIHILVVHSKP